MNRKILLLAFFEGFLLMAIELMCSRLMSPFYGATLYVITSILGVTLISIFCGYWVGGIQAKKWANLRVVSMLIITAAFLFCCNIPLIKIFSNLVNSLGLLSGTLFCTFGLLFLPLVLLGMVTPLLIEIQTRDNVGGGYASGRTYAISTLGGVAGTFLTGLVMAPNLGIKNTILTTAIVCVIVPFWILISNKLANRGGFSMILLFCFGLLLGLTSFDTRPSSAYKLYESFGVHGQLAVYGFPDGSRYLASNNAGQSKIDSISGVSYFLYTHAIASLVSGLENLQNKKALIIGLAGGSIIREFHQMGINDIDVVDIDPRMNYIAIKYFGIDPNWYHFIEDDGRHFLNQTTNMYDIVVVDVSAAEQQPQQLFTVEAFREMKSKLPRHGLLIFNVIDYVDTEKAKIAKGILTGLKSVGFQANLVKDFYEKGGIRKSAIESIAHERIIIAYHDFPKISTDTTSLNDCCSWMPFGTRIRQDFQNQLDLNDGLSSQYFTDDLPNLEKLSFERVNLLRTKYINYKF